MGIGTLGASIIRTVVPVVLGSFLGWLATLGIEFDPATSEALTSLVIVVITAAVTLVYYIVVRLIEQKFPQIGILLGLPKAPAIYTDAKVAGVKIETVEGRTQTAGSLVPAADYAAEGDGDPFNLYDRSTYDQSVAAEYTAKHRSEK